MLVPALFLAISISSVSPASGVAGATVTIRGSAFAADAQVWFAGIRGDTTFTDANTLLAVAPTFAPVTVDVTVFSSNTFATLSNAFTYIDTGDFERLLLPVFIPPTAGAFGSLFESPLSIWNTGVEDVSMFAMPVYCVIVTCPPTTPGPVPILLKARQGAPATLGPLYDGDPGRLFYIPKGAFDRLAASLRVLDITRSADSFGTRIPIVPEREFRSDILALIDVPSSARFRNTLRIYSLDPQTSVHLRVINADGTLTESETDIALRDSFDAYHPGYAEIANLAVPDGGRVEITPNAGKRVWAFVSVTNNVTQQITVVAPN